MSRPMSTSRRSSILLLPPLFPLLLCLLSLLLLPAPPALAQEPLGEGTQLLTREGRMGIFEGALVVPIGFSGLEVTTGSDNLLVGTMESEFRPGFALELDSPVHALRSYPFGDLGYYFRASLALLQVDQQADPWQPANTRDFGTSASGFTFSWGPVLMLEFPSGFSAGMGLGAGYGKIEGEILILDTTPFPPVETLHRFDSRGFALTWYFFAEYQWEHLLFGIRMGGLDLTDGDYTYSLTDYGFDIGWRMEF